MKQGKPFEGLGEGAMARGLAWAYGMGQRTHAALRMREVIQAGAPVISVGNLLVGGTGKTPLTAAIAAHLSSRGPAAIVSRGYGGRERGPVRVTAGDDPARVGDEPVEMAALAPQAAVWVARDRVAGARAAVAAGARVIVLDDGFGYRSLHRDADLLVFDERGVGNGRLLPAGPLREPVANVTRAHAVLLRGKAAPPPAWRGPVFHFRAELGGFVDWRGVPQPDPAAAVAAAGIAWPQRFFQALVDRGVRLTQMFPLTDHAPWAPSLAKRISDEAGGLPVIITGKDAVKLRRSPPPGVWLTAVQKVTVDDAFWPWLAERAKM
jgi:tetraacyldisaccharide 4'-kinase